MTTFRLLVGASLTMLTLAFPSASAKPRLYAQAFPSPRSTTDPTVDVAKANAAALVQPAANGFVNANQVYPYTEGSLFEVLTAVGKVTDIILQPGERLAGTGPVAAGDTARWIIGDTESGSGGTRQVHILVKPTQAALSTNLVINTDKRTYHIELQASPATYMAAVSWHYPQDALIVVRDQAQADTPQPAPQLPSSSPTTTMIDPTKLNFGYRIEGDHAPWRPLLAFDDGQRVFIELPPGIATSELPPLFTLGADGKDQLVNYRLKDNYFIVDHLFGAAELRLGDKHNQRVVRIKRQEHTTL
jgi:type IV secretion system protein VirB9